MTKTAPTTITWHIKPNAKQREAMLARTKYVGYGGARGGGKSWFVREKAKGMALAFPGITQLLVRRTLGELRNNHINQLKGDLNGVAKYNQQEKTFYFKNGSRIILGYCDNDNDLMQYQGAEYDIVYIDEATNLRQEWIQKITACVRGVNDFPKRVYMTCNPGGPGHGYIKRLFIDKTYQPGEDPDDYTFIQAKVTDNDALMESDPDYIKQLQALPERLRQAWLEGRFDVFEGTFFDTFVPRTDDTGTGQWTHVLPTPKKIPSNWRIYRSFDWGFHRPFSCGWWGVDQDGTIYRILELYGCTGEPNEGVKWVPQKVFGRIKQIENEHPFLKGKQITGVADPAIWDAQTGESIAETAAKQGVFFTKGDHRRLAGWMQCRYRLEFDDEGYPGMYVFDCCKDFVRTIPLLQYDKTDVEDIDTSAEDH